MSLPVTRYRLLMHSFVLVFCLVLIVGCSTTTTTWKRAGPIEKVECMQVQMRIGPFEGVGSWIQPALYAAAKNHSAQVFSENEQRFCGISMVNAVDPAASHILTIRSTNAMIHYRPNYVSVNLALELHDAKRNELIWKGTAIAHPTGNNDKVQLVEMRVLLKSIFRKLHEDGLIVLPNKESY